MSVEKEFKFLLNDKYDFKDLVNYSVDHDTRILTFNPKLSNYPYKLYARKITQGYVLLGKESHVRIRRLGKTKKGVLAFKADVPNKHRIEIEKIVSEEETNDLLAMSEFVFTKLRKTLAMYYDISGHHYRIDYDIDLYSNGLCVIEVEVDNNAFQTYFNSDSNKLILELKKYIDILGTEITGDKNYSNITLAELLNEKT